MSERPTATSEGTGEGGIRAVGRAYAGGWERLGRLAAALDADASGAGVLTLTADPFELGRALSRRRSVDQIRAFDSSADPGPHLAAFTWGPFTVRETPLVE